MTVVARRRLVPSSLALFALALAPEAAAQEPTWPPTGPTWITEPAVAFAKAQSEQKVVMAFVATAD